MPGSALLPHHCLLPGRMFLPGRRLCQTGRGDFARPGDFAFKFPRITDLQAFLGSIRPKLPRLKGKKCKTGVSAPPEQHRKCKIGHSAPPAHPVGLKKCRFGLSAPPAVPRPSGKCNSGLPALLALMWAALCRGAPLVCVPAATNAAMSRKRRLAPPGLRTRRPGPDRSRRLKKYRFAHSAPPAVPRPSEKCNSGLPVLLAPSERITKCKTAVPALLALMWAALCRDAPLVCVPAAANAARSPLLPQAEGVVAGKTY